MRAKFVLTVVLAALAAVTATPRLAAGGAPCLLPPVDAPIVGPFVAPPCPWCAGHRGLTYAVAAGTPVRAAAGGVVTFSGVVVGVLYVVVRHGDGLLATYGGLASTLLDAGDVTVTGSLIGWSGEELYFGLRRGPDAYVDPAPYLGRLVVRPYLVPTDGTARRPPPRPELRC